MSPEDEAESPARSAGFSSEQEREVINLLVDHTPERLQLECCLWTRAVVRALILREYGIEMPIRTVGEYLKRWGVTV